MQNRRLRERLAETSTLCTFLGLFVMTAKRVLAGLEIVDLAPWGFYVGLAFLALASLALFGTVYLDERHADGSYQDRRETGRVGNR